MEVGQRIKECRVKKGLTVDELADKLKKNRATIYRYENGDIENLPITVLEPIAKALGTSPAFLMGWTENCKALSQTSEKNNIMVTKDSIIPTEHEIRVLIAYRNQPAMQPAVDRILGISSKDSIGVEGNISVKGLQTTAVNHNAEDIKKTLDEAGEDARF
ncbi:helix-turn-helix domain-containing protein [Anaerotignum sp. MB30-C6]|uniref:helix-turn-helix domain-containing protein n=1 Tax=Anaerotignum sp. MB30-C6 TaxID=3070814 RepID=UPI0027DCE9C9|nr:helix-turn-helix transcriptional regulator [Anaerotignum sp. MB30-C6]WMI82189.1 helix-turn-helix transcriptional regulator [Anaerotignum sp. MB30-C6]